MTLFQRGALCLAALTKLVVMIIKDNWNTNRLVDVFVQVLDGPHACLIIVFKRQSILTVWR